VTGPTNELPGGGEVAHPPPVVSHPSGTTHELLREAAAAHGDVDAFVEAGGHRLTFAGWDRAADGVAAGLADLGVGLGDVVALLLPSSADYAVCYLAAMRLGAVTSGVNIRLGPVEVASILRRSRPRVVVRTPAVAMPDPVPDGVGRVVDRADVAAMGHLDRPPRLPAPDPDLPVAVVWTSGTTGDPKGAVFDHRNLAAVSFGAGPLRGPFDRRVSPTPFSHVGYMTHVAEDIGYLITTVIPPTPWKAGPVLQLMAAERVTVGQGVPSQWRLLLDHPDFAATDLSAVRICGTGAAPVPPGLVRELEDRLHCPVVIGYTSTEAALTTGTVPGDSPDVIATTVGRPRVNVTLRVVDDHGHELPAGEVGSVECRSDAVMRRYWSDPDRTAAVLGADGWLRTGDAGRLDPDGNLVLAGRRSEMYFRGGYNVYPAEVERVLSDHPAVAQVAVVAKDDPVLGHVGVAFVVPAGGAGAGAVTLDDLRVWTRRSLADYKAPDMLVVVDALPLTSVGKVDKRDLAARAAGLSRTV